MRKSKKNENWHVLTLCHQQKIYNYEIKTEVRSRSFFTYSSLCWMSFDEFWCVKTVCKKKAKVFSYQLRCNKGSDLRLNFVSKAQNEPHHDKTGFLHVRKERRSSAAQ